MKVRIRNRFKAGKTFCFINGLIQEKTVHEMIKEIIISEYRSTNLLFESELVLECE